MYTKLAELFTQPVIDIKDIKREADELLFNALFSAPTRANDTALAWLNLGNVIESCAYKHDATVLVHDSHIEDYLQKAAYSAAMVFHEDVRASIDIDAVVYFNRYNAYIKLIEYPTPIGDNTNGKWYFI